MPGLVENTAFASIAKYEKRTCKATLNRATVPGRLVVVTCTSAGGLSVPHYLGEVSGFTLLRSQAVRDLQLTAWYRQNCPSITSASVTPDDWRSMQVRILEVSGISQSNALDKFISLDGESTTTDTGSTGTTAQADEFILGLIANQYASTSQSGFSGGLTKLYENVSPEGYNNKSNADWERGRITIHQGVTSATGSFRLRANLSSTRRWISFLITFRGSTTGPVKFTSMQQPRMAAFTGTSAKLSVFGPLRATATVNNNVMAFGGTMARIGPFNYQYRLGGWTGLLIGTGTPYRVESVEGLEGWSMRTSDDELPRGDGALRGVDLQTARQVMFRLNFNGTQAEIETAIDILYRTLIPQRDSDWDLIYRHPGKGLRVLRARPVDLIREMDQMQLLLHNQAFALRAADPRHYAATITRVVVPVSPASGDPSVIGALNLGNAPAYPTIKVTVPSTGVNVTRVELVNSTTDNVFDVRAVITPRSVLTGDMSARATGQPRSIVTIDGQTKYGAWQFPRETFRLNPGENSLYLRTEPELASVECELTYQDTWSG